MQLSAVSALHDVPAFSSHHLLLSDQSLNGCGTKRELSIQIEIEIRTCNFPLSKAIGI